MEQARWVRDRKPVEAWVAAAVVKAGDRVARVAAAVVKAGDRVARAEAAEGKAGDRVARGKVAVLRQDRAVTAYAPSAVKKRLISSDIPAITSSVPSAERP